MSFVAFRDAVEKRFQEMAKKTLYRGSVEKDILWNHYIASFPPGSNPVFRKLTEHECSCCRNFIKIIGRAVTISDTGQIETVWDIQIDDPVYQTVANAMAALMRANPIKGTFYHYEENVGVRQNYESADGKAISWDHFHVKLPVRRNTGKNVVIARNTIATVQGKDRARYEVFYGGLEKITVESLDIILELIASNTLYRGQENQTAINNFRKLKVKYDALPEDARDNFVWAHVDDDPAATQLKNSTVGVLLVNLSEDDDLEAAVGKYEAMNAPENYRRPTALVTKAQVEKARTAIRELGFESALHRRYAHLPDISITNVLFADRSVSKAMKGGDVFDSLPTKGAAPKLDRIEEISIDKFISDVLPRATSVELMFENRHARNLASLIAPVDPAAKNMFKWDNPFSWTYTGDATDSIKERVKRAGGNVTGEFCCRLAWHNTDDLDFHMKEPSGREISFGNKVSDTTGGALDVDMNNGFHGRLVRDAVENIVYKSIARMGNGTYTLAVNQYRKRESTDVGFEIEIDHLGTIINMSYDRAVTGKINVAEIVKTADGLTIKPLLPSSFSTASKVIWGLKTQEFHKVNSIMLSPNYWPTQEGQEQAAGAKHYFFMLDGAVNEDVARGFYNEFLHPDLNQHRKVLEMVGAKMKTEADENQLSGVGFIATMRNNVVVRVSGASTRVLKVNF